MSTPLYPTSAPSPGPTPARSNAIGITALVLGIVALVLCWVPVFGLVLAVVALVFGGVGIAKSHKGMSITGVVTGAVALVVSIIILAAVGSVVSNTPPGTGATEGPAATAPTTQAPVQNADPTTEVAPTLTTPTAGDFAVGLSTISKQCFGSVGCDVVVQPNLNYRGDDATPDDYTCDITYEIDGGDSGPVVDTAHGTGGNQFSVTPTVLSTVSGSTVISSHVQNVSCT